MKWNDVGSVRLLTAPSRTADQREARAVAIVIASSLPPFAVVHCSHVLDGLNDAEPCRPERGR